VLSDCLTEQRLLKRYLELAIIERDQWKAKYGRLRAERERER